MAKPFIPEPKYFLKESCTNKKEYKSLYFQNLTNKIMYCAEKSTSYFESALAAKNIYNMFPDSRILIILRNPLERTWSNYKFSKLNKMESLDFSEAIKPESEKRNFSNISVNPFSYVSRSKYENYLKIYRDIFPEENIKVIIFEEFISDTKSSELFEWLGIEDKAIMTEYKVNPSDSEKMPTKYRLKLKEEFSKTIGYVEDYIGRDIRQWRVF